MTEADGFRHRPAFLSKTKKGKSYDGKLALSISPFKPIISEPIDPDFPSAVPPDSAALFPRRPELDYRALPRQSCR
jgi:hypothetical protein